MTDKKVIYFDVNQTMINLDGVKKEDAEFSILKIISEKILCPAGLTIKKSMLTKMDPTLLALMKEDEYVIKAPMTFKQFITTIVCPGDGNDKTISKLRDACYVHVLEILKKNCEGPFHLATYETLTRAEKMQQELIKFHQSGKLIFDSFINFIGFLEKEQQPYAAVFITFGDDMPKVEQELKARTTLKDLYHGKFTAGKLRVEKYHQNESFETKNSAKMLGNIRDFGHGSYQQDYATWKKSNFEHNGGKLCVFSHVGLQMVFDDNAENKQILNITFPDIPDELRACIDQKKLQQDMRDAGLIVSVDTYEAMTDPDYFIKKYRYACDHAQQFNFSMEKYLLPEKVNAYRAKLSFFTKFNQHQPEAKQATHHRRYSM
jgi:hypothetical protein